METISNIMKIKAIMEYYGLNQTQMAAKIGIHQTNLSEMFRGKRNCGESIIAKVRSAMPDINPIWLLTGEGEMLKPQQPSVQQNNYNGNNNYVVGGGNCVQCSECGADVQTLEAEEVERAPIVPATLARAPQTDVLEAVQERIGKLELAPVPITDENRGISDIPLSDRFVEATEKAAVSMLKICAWITLFSCFFSLVNEFGFDKNVVTAIRCLLEATGGCRAVSEYGNIYCVTATLGWSGLCVICQVLGDIRKMGTPFTLFVSFRAVHAALSAVVCHLLLTAFPLEASVFAPFAAYTTVEFFSASAPATLALLGLCTVFIIDLDRNKKIC